MSPTRANVRMTSSWQSFWRSNDRYRHTVKISLVRICRKYYRKYFDKTGMKCDEDGDNVRQHNCSRSLLPHMSSREKKLYETCSVKTLREHARCSIQHCTQTRLAIRKNCSYEGDIPKMLDIFGSDIVIKVRISWMSIQNTIRGIHL